MRKSILIFLSVVIAVFSFNEKEIYKKDIRNRLVIQGIGIDIENDFTPTYKVPKEKSKIVNELKKAKEKADEVILATDPDREGEAIAWHLCDVLKLDPHNTKRLEFHEITKEAVQEALNNPRNVDMNLVSSQETRRILDRIIGFKLSTLSSIYSFLHTGHIRMCGPEQ